MVLSSSNREATEAEIKHVVEYIAKREDELKALEPAIKKGQDCRSAAQKVVDGWESALRRARSLQTMIQSRLNSNLSIQSHASIYHIDIPEIGATDDEKESAHEDVVAAHRKELTKVGEDIEEDIQKLEDNNARIKKLERYLIEAGLKLQLEKTSLADTEAHRKRILDSIRQAHAMLQRGRGLPNEILIKIFGLVVDASIDIIRKDPQINQKFTVLALSRISSRWRSLVASTPQLWRYIPLPAPRQHDQYTRRMEVFKSYVKNGTGVTHIMVHWPNGFPWTDGLYSINNPLSYYFLRNSGSMLKFLANASSIELLGRTPSNIPKIPCQWPAANYILHYITPSFVDDASTSISRLSLQYSTLGSLIVNDLAGILRTLGNIKHLEILVADGTLGSINGNVVELPVLSSLSTSYSLVLPILWSLIDAPNLQHLHIQGSTDSSSSQIYQLQKEDISQARLDTIHSVTFSNSLSAALTDIHLLPMLQGLAGVQTLELRGKFLSSIISGLTTPPLLSPFLRTVIFCGCDIDSSVIKDFLRSRRRSTSDEGAYEHQITRVELDGCGGVTEACCEEIKKLVTEVVIRGQCRSDHQ
jgi:hypothetical protein